MRATQLLRDKRTKVCTEVLFIIAKMWTQPKLPGINDSIRKHCMYVCTVKHSSPIKKGDLVICNRMDELKDIMLNKINQE